MTHTSSMATPAAGALAKTREDVEELKRQWRRDPCWDIEDTEGYEEYRTELLTYRKRVEREAEIAYWEVRRQKAIKVGCSVLTADYILSLESQLERMTARLNALEEKR